MRQRDLSQLLVECLQKLDAGYTTDQILAEYPEQVSQLKPLLQLALSVQAAGKDIRIPASAQTDSRRQFLNQAQVLKQRRGMAGLWTTLRFIQHHLVEATFVLAAVAMLVIALSSASALPGDGLYPVKLTAEEVGSSLAGGASSPLDQQAVTDQRRLDEVTRMIQSGRTGDVHFAGFLDPDGASGWLIADIPLTFDENSAKLASALSGGYVEVTGTLNQAGKVEVTQVQPRLINLEGSLQSQEAGRWTVNDTFVLLTEVTQVNGVPQVGSPVMIQAARMRDPQQVLAVTVDVESDAASEPTTTSTTTSTATPTPTKTALPTLTPTATGTPTPSMNFQPTATIDNGDGQELDNSSDDHSGSGGESGDDGDEEEKAGHGEGDLVED